MPAGTPETSNKVVLSGSDGITAILDGQQRLTSLFIGLKGTYAEKKPYYRWESDHAFPVTRLYLNLTEGANALELKYDFQFFQEEENLVERDGNAWFRVGHILQFSRLTDIITFLRDNNLIAEQFPQDALTALFEAITQSRVLNYYLETDQRIDKVLNIFIRVNSAGTELSYSDLLLSIATAQWQHRDAREEIHGLVDEINQLGDGFRFSKDFVLKTCLMVADLDTRWTVQNFTRANMKKIESIWDDIARAIRMTVKLLATFGFSGDNLPSVNTVIPIVYYLYQRGMPRGYVDSSNYRDDRVTIKQWLIIALLKRVFTGQPDAILRVTRQVIQKHHDAFPNEEIAKALRSTSRSMRFDVDELQAILETRYGKSYTFVTLALLYPWLDFTHKFHQDHIYPRTAFYKNELEAHGITDPIEIDKLRDLRDRLPNLQLLQGIENQEKADTPFSSWIANMYPEEQGRSEYMERHYIPDVELSVSNYETFYQRRRQMLLERLANITGVTLEEQLVPSKA